MMTAAYSNDLRERVVRSYENGRGKSWIAREFGICLGSVKRYIARYQQTGSVAPTKARHPEPKIRAEQLVNLQAIVDAQPDATIEQYIEQWEARFGVRVGQANMCRSLQRANRPRKKDTRRAGA
jgi:transposase